LDLDQLFLNIHIDQLEILFYRTESDSVANFMDEFYAQSDTDKNP